MVLLSYSLTNILTLLYTQFFGHGDPVFPTTARNQIHIQFEKDDGILGIIKDSGDLDRYTIPCMKEWCPSEAYVKEHPNCAWEFPNEVRNEVPKAGQNGPCSLWRPAV
jgi:hypothetical protein